VGHKSWRYDDAGRITGTSWISGTTSLFTQTVTLDAGQLRPGDRLRTEQSAEVTVVRVEWNVGDAEVYTFTVTADHTFFIGTARELSITPRRAHQSGRQPTRKRRSRMPSGTGTTIELISRILTMQRSPLSLRAISSIIHPRQRSRKSAQLPMSSSMILSPTFLVSAPPLAFQELCFGRNHRFMGFHPILITS
jgi:hypothetical protein